jgi:hypothetical protein
MEYCKCQGLTGTIGGGERFEADLQEDRDTANVMDVCRIADNIKGECDRK